MNQYYDINEELQGQAQQEGPREAQLPQLQNEIQDIENNDDKCCCGLLNRSDHILIILLKLILALPLLPLVLIWKILQWLTILLYDFCTNQLYNCLLYVSEKFSQFLQFLFHLLSILFKFIYFCLTFIGKQLLKVIYFIGRCSKCALDWYATFIIYTIFKFAHFQSIIQEFTAFITVPISLKIIIPLAMCFYLKIFTPIKTAVIYIAKKLFYAIKKTIEFLYNSTVNYILKPFYYYIILNILRIIRFLLVDIVCNIVIANLYKGLRWSIINFYTYILVNIFKYLIVKFLYEIVLTYSCKALKLFLYDFLCLLIIVPLCKATEWILVDFLYEIILVKLYQFLRFIIVDVIIKVIVKIAQFIYFQICVNLFRCLAWIIIRLIYELILRNIYLYVLQPLYNFLVSILRIITTSLYRFILLPLWNLIKYLFNGLVSIISAIGSFIYYSILNPMWNLITIITRGIIDLIKKFFTAVGQLSIDLWTGIRNLASRLRNMI